MIKCIMLADQMHDEWDNNVCFYKVLSSSINKRHQASSSVIKGSRLDLNMMRFIHGREWRSRLCDKIVTDKMKPDIVKACPSIQLGGIPEASSDDHLIHSGANQHKRTPRFPKQVYQKGYETSTLNT